MTPLDNLEERLAMWLGQLGLDSEDRTGGVRALAYGDVVVLVSAFAQDGATWLRVAAIVRTEVEPSLEMLHHLLQYNNAALIGRFLLFEDRTLVFSETLHGGAVHLDAFERTLRYVAHTADSFTDAFGGCCGGRPGADATHPAGAEATA